MTSVAYGAEEFAKDFHVSRETLAALTAYQDILLKWNARINLIARASEADLWRRHFADSAQLYPLPSVRSGSWSDLGAGAGFPGLIIAALARDAAQGFSVTLVESDSRKCVFLSEAARTMGLNVSIITGRIETLQPLRADVISARGLSALDRLLEIYEIHRAANGIGLFPKGQAVHNEIARAEAKWRFEPKIHPSVTESGASIVEIGSVSRV